MAEAVAVLSHFRGSLVQILAGTISTLTEILSDLTQALQINVGKIA
jgi:hypothetical protein